MSLDLPPDVPIDRSRAGRLSIAPVMLGHLLRLPAGHEVVAAQIGPGGAIEVFVLGADMPSAVPIGPTQAVTLLINRDVRPEHRPREERLTLSWAHLPEKRWTLHGWEPIG